MVKIKRPWALLDKVIFKENISVFQKMTMRCLWIYKHNILANRRKVWLKEVRPLDKVDYQEKVNLTANQSRVALKF